MKKRVEGRPLFSARQLGSHVPIGRATLDCQLRVLQANSELSRLSGKSPNALLGRSIQKAFPFLSPILGPILQQVIRTGEQVYNSKVSGRRHAATRDTDDWIISCNPLRSAKGDTRQIQVHLQSIDKLQRAHANRHNSEDWFRVLADSAPLMVWQSDPNRRCTYLNEEWLKFTGRPMKQQMGDGWLKNVHPQDRPRCLETYVRAFEGRRPFTMEYRVRRFDGEYRWIVDRGVAWHQPDGKFAGYLGSCLDITDRKRAEEALQRSEEFSRVVMMSLRNHVAILDADGKMLVVNEAWQRDAGHADRFPLTDVVEGTNYRDVCRQRALNGEQKDQAILDGIETVLDGSHEHFSMEYHCDLPSGSKWFLMDVVPLRRAGGGAVISYTDITNQKRQQLQAQESANELAHMRRVLSIGELAASLAHELNQPLTAILTNAQAAVRILKMASPDLEEIQQILKDVISDDKRAGEVIRRLRVLLKKKDLELGPLQINNVINEVVEILRSDAILRQASIQLDLDPDLPLTYGDDVQLQQVLLNLVQNGLDAMHKTPPEQRIITIRSYRDSDEVLHVSVKDNGHGIEKDQMDRVFVPFYTTKAEGLGLGLAVTRSIIESHKGRLWAENNPTGGTLFHFTMPSHSGAQ